MKLIKIKNLNKNYYSSSKEISVLKDINIDINTNDIIGIIGKSGCGKSTLLNIIANLDKEYDGSIIKYNKINIGYMMQNDTLLSYINNYENALLGLKLKKIQDNKNIEYVNKLIEKYQLKDFKLDYPNQLSGGLRQRLSLIRTLAIKPNLLLLDEPFSKLDEKTHNEILEDVKEIIKENKIGTLLITHNIKEALTLCNKIIILSNHPARIIKLIEIKEVNNQNVIKKYYKKIKELLDNE